MIGYKEEDEKAAALERNVKAITAKEEASITNSNASTR
jgi:hypothetical protein